MSRSADRAVAPEALTRPATENEVMLWHCEKCSLSGALIMDPHAAVYEVVEALRSAHSDISPACEAGIGDTRCTRPDDWFRSVTDLAKKKARARA